MRSSRFTALELAQTLRYLPDLVVVLALLAAVGFCAPNRASGALAGCVAGRTHRGGRVLAAAFLASSLYSTVDVPDQLARQPRPGPTCTTRGQPGRSHTPRRMRRCWIRRSIRWYCSGWRGRRTWPATCSRYCRIDPNLHQRQRNCACWTSQGPPGGRAGDLGAAPSVPARRRSAATSCSPTSRCGCPWTDRCCPPTGPSRSITWPTATAR